MKTLLWLDDVRDPFQNDWLNFSPIGKNIEVTWITNYQDFVDWITTYGLPDAICFDHDLSDLQAFKSSYPEMVEDIECNEKTGYDCAKWLVEYCINNDKSLPKYAIQSANPVGKENINSLLTNFNKFNKNV